MGSVCIAQIFYKVRGEGPVTSTAAAPKALSQDEGLRLQSGPGRDLVFKLTGDDTSGAIDYFICEVAPHGGPPLHVHHTQEETIHVLSGRMTCTADDGTVTEVGPGSTVVFPKGWAGTWDIHETLRKVYVIFK